MRNISLALGARIQNLSSLVAGIKFACVPPFVMIPETLISQCTTENLYRNIRFKYEVHFLYT